MRKIKIADGLDASLFSAGCMRISKMEFKEADAFVRGCLDAGVNYFDHAVVYGEGACETIFGGVLNADKSLKDKLLIQTKCGIVRGKMFDFSYENIINSVNGSLTRLGVETIDALLLHRPDALVEPEEVARAFDELHKAGKVRFFGVSNHTPYQTELLKTAVKQPLVINQVQFSAAFTGMVDTGFYANTKTDGAVHRDGGIIEHARIHNTTLQAWSPLQYGRFEGLFIGSDKYPALNETLNALAEKYKVTPTAIACAFVLRHPAKWQVITGTTKPERIREMACGADITLMREEWYKIYMTAGNKLPL